MTLFALTACVLAALALMLLTRPWWRRERDAGGGHAAAIADMRRQLGQLQALHEAGTLGAAAYGDARTALERRLVDAVVAADPGGAAERAGSRRGIALLALFVLGVALAGYAWLGTPQALQGGGTAPVAGADGAHPVTPDQIESMVERLAARLREQPEDAQGWAMLARSYAVLGRHQEALPSFEKAVQLRGDDASLLADYADALAVTNGRSLEGEPAKLIARALAFEPSHLKVLSLAGTLAFDRKDYATAIRHWESMVSQDPRSELTRQILGGIDEARLRLGGAVPPAPGATAAAKASPSGASVTGIVRLAEAVAVKVQPDDTVFVFARAAEGARMPLAILRKQVRDLPLTFTLDDTLAMSPAARLSSAARVVIGARVSKSGGATPQPGDLQGFSAVVAPGASQVEVAISEVVGR